MNCQDLGTFLDNENQSKNFTILPNVLIALQKPSRVETFCYTQKNITRGDAITSPPPSLRIKGLLKSKKSSLTFDQDIIVFNHI